ncbi:alpha-galactosidase [Enterococcus timonensis]|uniref:alpha-galactosidase n=1 Tax=Enterococcus timonensis TaxID=1852364 RepID=UPI0008D9087D|nr:alpha-galactosidase [Enterococcus timonensis]
MITFLQNVFYLQTKNTSYWFQITKHGHLEQIYYGPKLPIQDPTALIYKRTAQTGSTIAYDAADIYYALDELPLEYSPTGVGDYRFLPSEIQMADGSFVSDFLYDRHEIIDGVISLQSLPTAKATVDESQSLRIELIDALHHVRYELFYTVFFETNVITRKVRVVNLGATPITIHKIMSSQLDLPNRNYQLHTFNGTWAKETHQQIKDIQIGEYSNSSTTGDSSNRANPGILLGEKSATENQGWVYGMNLVYSGNHYSHIELSPHGLLRTSMGINPQQFQWALSANEFFETPEVCLSFSANGFNGLSGNFHHFINHHIIPQHFQEKLRPVVYNNWEATFMDFNQAKLLKLAKQAKNLGAETFVLDDGWFGTRNDDTQGLGDYAVNRKKFPQGLKSFADKLRSTGLEFGLWFEPEMVNPNSQLYKEHPEFAVQLPGKNSVLGRNQLVLDLCQKEVRTYIIENVGKILDETGATFVKWDMNRHIAEAFSATLTNQGEFYHRYMMGLYEVLSQIFGPRPEILLESCSSGGNRFDLGMLCFSPQIWASDDTDPIERLEIQGGLSYLYPPSTISCHVSASPHQQTLRATPLSSRFNVASFGVLGYELDLNLLTPEERKEIKEQITFYKKYRATLQFGKFSRTDTLKSTQKIWQAQGTDQETVAGFFQTKTQASPSYDLLPVSGLAENTFYKMTSKPQRIFIQQFGELIKHVTPVKLNPHGLVINTIAKHYSLTDAKEEYFGTGGLFASGVLLKNQFMGSNYNDQTRLLGDFGSTLYVVSKEEGKEVGQ